MTTENIWETWFGQVAGSKGLRMRMSGFESLFVLAVWQRNITYSPLPQFPHLENVDSNSTYSSDNCDI